MPNWVTNVVVVEGPQEDIESLDQLVVSEESEFDFKKIVPPPGNMVGDSITMDEAVLLRSKGIPYWYDWQCENWGTKWSASNAEILVSGQFSFETAWSMPKPVFVELSRKFPTLTIYVDYADEDIGHNCGRLSFKNGEMEDLTTFKQGTDEACEFACQLRYGQSYEEIRAEWE